MKLLVEPSDGVAPVVQAIDRAKSRLEIAIFRFDRNEIEKALARAVSRGVLVHALIAHTNRGGEQSLRKLEMRLLAAGATVARTASDLTRYHGKYMIVDRRELYVLSFNFTRLDIDSYVHSKFIRKGEETTGVFVDFEDPHRPALFIAFNAPEFVSRVNLEWIGRNIPKADAKWLGQLLGRLSHEQIRDAFRSAQYTPEENGIARER